MKKMVICGGGSSAHALIPLLNDSDFEVSILSSRPNLWHDEIELQYQDTDGNLLNRFLGKISKASANPGELIPDADFIVLCMPVHKYRVCLHSISSYINPKKTVCIGAIYGQGGFNWMVDEIKRLYSLENVVAFSFGLIPWICRTIEYGHIGVTYGCKAYNVAAVSQDSMFGELKKIFLDQVCYRWFGKGETHQAKNFLSLTLSVDNQIIHPSRCFGLYKRYGKTWDRKELVPMFYKDYDELSATILRDLDSDYSRVREEIKKRYPREDFSYMLDYLSLERLSYNSCNTDIRESFITSQTLTAIGTPVIQDSDGRWMIDINHRFFLDDIYYGICIAKWFAQKLNLGVQTIDAILEWVQRIRSENIIDISTGNLLLDSKDLCAPLKSGMPNFYGYEELDDVIS